jgi:hypothetical protein
MEPLFFLGGNVYKKAICIFSQDLAFLLFDKSFMTINIKKVDHSIYRMDDGTLVNTQDRIYTSKRNRGLEGRVLNYL